MGRIRQTAVSSVTWYWCCWCSRFCAAIHREHFPYERVTSAYKWVQPAHTITLLSPITVVSLLPYDLHYAVKDAPSGSAGRVKPGQCASLTQVALLKWVLLILKQIYLSQRNVFYLLQPLPSSFFMFHILLFHMFGIRYAKVLWKGNTQFHVLLKFCIWSKLM